MRRPNRIGVIALLLTGIPLLPAASAAVNPEKEEVRVVVREKLAGTRSQPAVAGIAAAIEFLEARNSATLRENSGGSAEGTPKPSGGVAPHKLIEPNGPAPTRDERVRHLRRLISDLGLDR
jgi:hypothetical protein